MSNGCVRMEVWNAIGNAATTVRIDVPAAKQQPVDAVDPYTG
ncbi:hypothetical protein [Dactylosporangium maewongense]